MAPALPNGSTLFMRDSASGSGDGFTWNWTSGTPLFKEDFGNPADGHQVIEAVRSTGGSGAAVSDVHIVNAIQLLAQTEGIFTEPAGGTTLAATIDLVERGIIPREESIVVCVTGNGYKTTEVVMEHVAAPVRLTRAFKDFEAWWAGRTVDASRDVVLS